MRTVATLYQLYKIWKKNSSNQFKTYKRKRVANFIAARAVSRGAQYHICYHNCELQATTECGFYINACDMAWQPSFNSTLRKTK